MHLPVAPLLPFAPNRSVCQPPTASAAWGIIACLLCLATFQTMALAQAGRGKSAQADALFRDPGWVELSIQVPPEGVERLEKAEWTFGQQNEREKVSVTVIEGARTYTNVTLQLKGAAGSFRKLDDKPAMTLNFNNRAPKQHFHGLEKLSLNNSVQDSTYLNEIFSRELFAKAGVPAPRATHARVKLNGRDLGLYVLVEGWDREFLKRNFAQASGHLYDGGFAQEITGPLATNVGTAPPDRADLKALADATKEKDLMRRHQRLEALLDLPRFITALALDIILWNWDGYALNRNNWRLYADPGSGKFVFMPHGLDQLLWKPDGSILPAVQGSVARAVLEIPQLRQRYLARLAELRQAVFVPDQVIRRIRDGSAKVERALRSISEKELNEHRSAVDALCTAVATRADSLDRQLANPPTVPAFDESDRIALRRGWQPQATFGRPLLDHDPGHSAVPDRYLHIAARSGSSIGAWRNSLWLEKGRYRLEGQVKTTAIVADSGDSRPGVAFRVNQRRPEKPITDGGDWRPLAVEFAVDDPLSDIQIYSELRGAAGEAWFDTDSIRIVRLKE